MSLLAGRNFSGRDAVSEFVVNEELMHKLGIRDPEKILGRALEDGNTGTKGEVVGVVGRFHLKSLHEAVEPCVIFAYPDLYKELAIKLNTGDLARTIRDVEQVWQKFYPEEVFSYQFLDEKIAGTYEKENQLTGLIRAFAIVAILICCLGLYGMVSFMVSRRTKEIGIRKVLGASVENIVALFGTEFFLLVLIAFFVASPIAWYTLNDWLNDFAYRIDISWWIVASGGILTLFTALAAVALKVMKAARMNAVRSLRSE